MSGDQYRNIDGGMDYALEKTKARQRRSMWIVLGSVIALVIIIGVGVGVGVSMANKNKTTKASSTSSSGGSSSGGGGTTTGGGTSGGPAQTDPNDPSSFVKDPNLKKSFYGMAYTPEGAIMPECGAKLESVIKDVQLLSQLTTRIRLYGSDCNQTALVLEAIKQTKVEMEVFLGNYVVPTDKEAYTRQRDAMKAAIQTYGTDHIVGVSVGNEFMLNYLDGDANVNGPKGNEGAALLIADIKDTREMLAGLNLPKTIPVGTSDAGSYFNTLVLESIDYGLSNVHAWFANTTEAGAAKWVFDFFQETNVAPTQLLANKPKMYIAETGWPTASSDVSNETNGAGHASIAGLQTFLDTFVCQANAAGTGYFFFELIDEPWKDALYGGVEGHWGLFTKDRVLKQGIKIPDCPAP